MAKNKKLEMDAWDFDDELDLPDFDFGNGPPVKDDRKPATKLLMAAGEGYLENHISPDNIRHFVKKALPRGYGEALDTADQTASSLRSLYNTTAKEVKPVINEIKKTSQRLIPAADKVLPKKLAEKFKNWTHSIQTNGSADLTREQMKEAGIQAELGDIFKAQAEETHKRQVEGDARERVRDGVAFTRHKDVLSNLAPMRRSMQELSEYQRTIGINYQRKSLELQLRSYYVQAESLEENKRQNIATSTHLEGILKNTGLPEYAKLKTSERLAEMVRNRFLDKIGDTLQNKRRNFMANMVKRAGGQLQDKVRNGVDQVRAGLGAYESLAELREMQAQFGRQQTGGEQAAGMAGGMLSQHHTNKFASWLNSQMEKNQKITKGGNRAAYFVQNLPQLALEWARSDRGIGKNGFGTGSGWMDAIKENIRSVLSPESTNVESDKLEDVRNVDVFNRRTNRSITDIIPGYLSRIYRELKIIRTGDDKQELVEYDYTNNKFAESSTVRSNILNKLVGKGDKDALKRELDDFVAELDQGNQLTPEQKRTLGKKMLENNLDGQVGDSRKYMDERSDVYRSLSNDDAEKMAAVFKKYFADDENELKRKVFANQFAGLGHHISDKRASVQDIVNLNQRHHLDDLGILDGDTINMEKLREYLLADDSNVPTSQVNGRRVSRRRDGQTAPVTRMPVRQLQMPSSNQQQPGVAPQVQVTPQASPATTARQDNSDVVRAIEAANPTMAINDGNKMLAHIIELLENGIMTHGGSGSGRQSGRWWNRSVGSLASSTWDGTVNSAKWLRNRVSAGRQRVTGAVSSAWDGARRLGEWGSKKLKEFNDVYIEGEAKPRLLAWKLRAERYRDQVTGDIIRSYKDIKNAVVDEDGNVVLTLEQAQQAFEKSRLGKKLISALGFVRRQAKNSWDMVQRVVPGIYGRGLKLGIDTFKKVGELLDQPQDIYVAGKKDPVLLAVTMRAGGYASRITSNEIRRPSQIDGPVVDERGDVVLTAEQLASGLLDKHGNPLKTGYKGLLQRVKNFASRSLKAVTGAFRGAKDWVVDKARGLAKGFDFNFGMNIGTQSRNQSVLLLQIRDMLNARLPGERTTFAEDVHIDAVGGNTKRLKESVNNGFSKAREQLEKLNLKERLKELREKGRNKKNKAKDKMAELFEKYFGKKKVAGDSDGDGVRDGSYQDLLRRQKEKLKAVKEKAGEKLAAAKKGGKSLLGTAGEKTKSLLDYFKKKKKDGEDDDGVDIDIDAANDNEHHRRRRRRRRKPKGFWNKVKAAGRGGLGMGKRLLGMGGKLLGGVGTAYGAYSAYQNLQEGNYGDAAIDAGLTAGGALLTTGGISGLMGGLGGVAGGLGAVAAGIGSVLASPVVLTALAVGAIGAAGYYGYKYLTKFKLDPYSRLRYAQYGFLGEDDKHLQQIFELESMFTDIAVFSDGKASFDEKKVDAKKVLGLFDIDVKKREQVQNFILWFDGRFKPTFLNNVAALRAVDPKKSLRDIAELTVPQKWQYLNVAKFPGGPYNVFTSPFPDQSQLVVGQPEVAAATELAEAALQKDEKGAPATAKDGARPGATAAIAAVTAAPSAGLPGVKLPEKVPLEKIDTGKVNQITRGALGAGATTTGAITVAGPDIMSDVLNTGRLDALTALRYRTYGLVEFQSDKVRALNLLEAETKKGMTIVKGVASWTGSVEKMIAAMGSTFGVQGVANDDAYTWLSWFNGRFLPTYLAYVSAMVTTTKKTTLEQAVPALTAIQAVDVATMIYTAKGSYNGSMVSVWQIQQSPWPGYQLNADVKTTEGNFQSLKDQAKRAVVLEESTDVRQGVTNSSTGSQAKEESKPGFFGKLFAERKDAQNKPSGNIFSRIYENAKDMLSTSSGREIAHPGKGTGGDINAIPMPKGNGSWAALKDTITAAAKMVGVDEKLMATMAAIESGFNYSIKATTSSATGLYQFTRDTWNSMKQKFAAKYGIDPDTPATDPRANALLGAEFIKYNAQSLAGLGRKLTDTDLYTAHFLGAGGAKKFLSASPDAIAANVMPDAAAANQSIFYSSGRALTVAEVYAKLNGLIRNKGKQFGIDDGSEKIVSASAPSSSAPPAAAAVVAAAPKAVSLPVSDQTPIPTAAVTSPTTPTKAAPVVAAAAIPTEAPAASAPDPVEMTGYSSTRSRNLAAQQQYQRDQAAEKLTTTNQILEKSYGVQSELLGIAKQSLEVLKDLRKAPLTTASQTLDKPVEVVKPAAGASRGPMRPMANAPVSMAVNG